MIQKILLIAPTLFCLTLYSEEKIFLEYETNVVIVVIFL